MLLKEVLHFLDVGPGRRFIDSTAGGGGHTEAILERKAKVLGIDQDPAALEIVRKRLKVRLRTRPRRDKTRPNVFRVKLVQKNFTHLQEVASKEGFQKINGVLFDLGFASFQLDSGHGLSFSREEPLDMRLDPTLGVTASDLVNSLPEHELTKLFFEFGQEKQARAIARNIVRTRSLKPVETTTELASLVEEVYKRHPGNRIHPATRVFMALRMAVNTELENLEQALPQAVEVLKKGGRLVVISFHSGEDRIVKEFMRKAEKEGLLKILTKKPVMPKEEEIEGNPRARSAKLRAAEKI